MLFVSAGSTSSAVIWAAAPSARPGGRLFSETSLLLLDRAQRAGRAETSGSTSKTFDEYSHWAAHRARKLAFLHGHAQNMKRKPKRASLRSHSCALRTKMKRSSLGIWTNQIQWCGCCPNCHSDTVLYGLNRVMATCLPWGFQRKTFMSAAEKQNVKSKATTPDSHILAAQFVGGGLHPLQPTKNPVTQMSCQAPS